MIQWFSKKLKNRKGFTLIELIVVIAILGILALLAIPRFIGTLETSRVRTDVATARTIVSAVAVGEAEGEYTLTGTTGPDVAQLVTDKYLDAEPESAQTGGGFSITYADGSISTITVTGTGATVTTVYPYNPSP